MCQEVSQGILLLRKEVYYWFHSLSIPQNIIEANRKIPFNLNNFKLDSKMKINSKHKHIIRLQIQCTGSPASAPPERQRLPIGPLLYLSASCRCLHTFNSKRYQCLDGYIIPKCLTPENRKCSFSISQSCLHLIIL